MQPEHRQVSRGDTLPAFTAAGGYSPRPGPSTSYASEPSIEHQQQRRTPIDVQTRRGVPHRAQLPRQSSLNTAQPPPDAARPHLQTQRSLQTYGADDVSSGSAAQHHRASLPHHRPTEHEQRVLNEFQLLVDKSKQLFNGIRDLPLHGTKQWQGYFGRTFEIFTRLWKYQQQHRLTLDRLYGLKRWQIGEMASKIGQLYYHYYLRTSETTYLLETFSFYSAVRSRDYYSNVAFSKKPDLTVKKLRYYARFIVVCLLLKKLKLVRDLVRELSQQVEQYTERYDPHDQVEWAMILSEIKSFVDADHMVSIVDVDSSTVVLSHRLTSYSAPPFEKGVPVKLVLSEVLLVGNTAQQVKCTELSLDMYWMLQALEREPHDEHSMLAFGTTVNSSPAPGRTPYDDIFVRSSGKENPHKYLLYKPTIGQLLLFLTCAYRDLAANGVLLLYISADGSFVGSPQRVSTSDYDSGGVCTSLGTTDTAHISNVPNVEEDESLVRVSTDGRRDLNSLHSADLYPFTRRPLFLIVESDNSSVFLGMPNLFVQPLVTLVGPTELPAFLQKSGQPTQGSLFTLFLHSPLTAFCRVNHISEIPIALWDKCQAHVDKFMEESGRLLVRSPSTDRAFIEFYSDDFLRLITLRYIFSAVTLRLHRSFRASPNYQPRCHPPLPPGDVIGNALLQRLILDLALILDVLAAFRDTEETVC